MNTNDRYTERLARLILYAGIAAIAFLALRYFSSVVAYIALAVVISLIAKPLMGLLRKIQVKKKSAPEWLLALISISLLLLVVSGLIAGLVPVISKVISEVRAVSSDGALGGISTYLANFNEFLRGTFSLEKDFKVEAVAIEQLKSALNVNLFGNMLGSVASTVVSICIGVFSVVFISFFLIKDETLLARLLQAVSPERLETQVTEALQDVEHLLSRYFVGLIIEMSCVGMIDFLGLWAIARLDFESALGIGFLAGMLNIIPYLGPVLGGLAGTTIGLILKYCSATPLGLDVNFWVFVLILALIFISAQLVDNFILQPLIYSTSIRATPLEIFIVMLLAGTIGGTVGMLVAIPTYTVIRVIAIRFFPDVKFIRRLVK